MTLPKFPTRELARKAGWFSRRHQTPDANREAREAYRDECGVQARRERAYARGAEKPKSDV